MAHPAAADPPRVTQQTSTPLSTPPVPLATKNLVTREFDLALRAFFPTPTAPAKFNPITAMNQLLRTMIKDEPSLVLCTPNNDKQLVLASDRLPTGETEFKKFFKVSTTRIETKKQTHVCIGCHVLSNRSLGSIKFKSNENLLLAWLKKSSVFIESDSLGIERPVTIGYFTKIEPTLTHLANFRDQLVTQLTMIDIDAETALTLAPHLKTAQLEAMTNGDDFIPILPNFEVFRTQISHGRPNSQVTTDVIGVKGAPKDAKLLGEFFTRLAADNSADQRDGVFILKGAVNLIGPATFEQVVKNNNFFLTTVATVPVNLEYDAWFALIDANHTSENEPISLHEHLLRQSWFIRLEYVSRNKVMLVTTKNNLPAARAWIDANLEPMIRKSMPPELEPPPSHLLPRRLDKPVHTTTSITYADILKKQFSLESTSLISDTANDRPPRKRLAAVLNYDSDQSEEAMVVDNSTPHDKQSSPSAPVPNSNCTQSLPTPQSPMVDYAAELAALKNDLKSLRTLITTAVEQLKMEISSLHAPAVHDMETDVEQSFAAITPDISDLIADLKHDIATVALEMRSKFHQQATLMSQTTSKCTSAT